MYLLIRKSCQTVVTYGLYFSHQIELNQLEVRKMWLFFRCRNNYNIAIYTGSLWKKIQKENVIIHYWILPAYFYSWQELWRCGTQGKKMILLQTWSLYREKTRETVGLWHLVNCLRTLTFEVQMEKSLVLQKIPSSPLIVWFVDYSDGLLRQT